MKKFTIAAALLISGMCTSSSFASTKDTGLFDKDELLKQQQQSQQAANLELSEEDAILITESLGKPVGFYEKGQPYNGIEIDLQILKALGDSHPNLTVKPLARIGSALLDLGDLYGCLPKLHKALRAFQKTTAEFKEKNPYLDARLLAKISTAFLELSRFRESIDAGKASLGKLDDYGPRLKGELEHNISVAEEKLSQRPESLLQEVDVMSQIGRASFQHNQLHAAIRPLSIASGMFDQFDDFDILRKEADIKQKLGMVLLGLGEQQERGGLTSVALYLFDRAAIESEAAVTTFQRYMVKKPDTTHPQERMNYFATLLHDHAVALMKLSLFDKADAALMHALSCSSKGGELQARLFDAVARNHFGAKRYQNAFEYCMLAIESKVFKGVDLTTRLILKKPIRLVWV